MNWLGFPADDINTIEVRVVALEEKTQHMTADENETKFADGKDVCLPALETKIYNAAGFNARLDFTGVADKTIDLETIGGGGNPFDQSLNTTDSPEFVDVTMDEIVLQGNGISAPQILMNDLTTNIIRGQGSLSVQGAVNSGNETTILLNPNEVKFNAGSTGIITCVNAARLRPQGDNITDLGSVVDSWKDIYLDGNINQGGTLLTMTGATPGQILVANGSGDFVPTNATSTSTRSGFFSWGGNWNTTSLTWLKADASASAGTENNANVMTRYICPFDGTVEEMSYSVQSGQTTVIRIVLEYANGDPNLVTTRTTNNQDNSGVFTGLSIAFSVGDAVSIQKGSTATPGQTKILCSIQQ